MTHPRTSLLHFLLLLLLLAGLFAPRPAVGQAPSATTPSRTLSLELDPAPFLLNGYSFSLRYTAPGQPHWSVMASAFAAHFPDGMLTTANREAGWSDLEFHRSHALFVDYSFRTDGRGFYCGPSVFLYDNEVTHAPSGTTQRFKSIYPNVRLGYTWFPLKRAGLYLSPWVNVGSEMPLNEDPATEGPQYEVAGFKYVVALHVGYRYTFR